MPKEIEILVGRRIEMRRKELALTTTDFAKLIGISQQQQSRIERGECKITVSRLLHIAVITDTPIDWFFQDCYPYIQQSMKDRFAVDVHARRRRKK
ncbi:helix-turn-helix domain-containing protein (plasmid) [Xenorhabdus stockiae]|uniref:helix-turn-helix domain-containing protein n=1 Tax=Xenorhabdus stockiae TaxID=351614 RepID=UPI003CE7B89E